MKNDIINISATIYSLSSEKKSILRGWYLLVTPDGEEYVMRRHLGISSRRYWRLYCTNISLREYIADSESKKGSHAIFWGIAGGTIATRLIPIEYLLGPSHTPFSLIQALLNTSLILLIAVVFVMLLSNIRDFRFKRFIARNSGKLERIGDVRAAAPLRYMSSGKGYW